MTSTTPPPALLTRPANVNFSDNGRRGRYGIAYLSSLCATAGIGFKENAPDEDVDALDVSLKFARATAEVQVKCSSTFTVGLGRATLPLEPPWVAKWQQSYTPVFVVLVKVPVRFDHWLDFKPSSTSHQTLAFGKRFDPTVHTTSMQFTRSDRLTVATLYDWRDQVYDHHERGVA